MPATPPGIVPSARNADIGVCWLKTTRTAPRARTALSTVK
jgi:hypothetical protein